jgi:chorismate synthase
MYSFIGIFEGKTTGTSIVSLPNTNQKSDDYSHIKKDNYRPSRIMFMKIRNPRYRGGGRSSARETASRVVGVQLPNVTRYY